MSEDQRQLATRSFVYWLWWRFTGRRVVRNPIRLLIALVSIGLATTLWAAVTRVGAASARSFEESLGLDNQSFQVFLSPVGGRLGLDTISPCLRAVASSVDVLVIRRENGVLQGSATPRAVSVAGVSAFAHDVWATRTGSSIELSSRVAAEMGLAREEAAVLTVGGRIVSSSVSSAMSSGASRAEYATPADVVVPLSALGRPVAVDVVAFRRENATPEALISELKPQLEACLGSAVPIRIETLTAPIERSESLLAAYRFNILIMSAITVLVCGLLVSQATRLSLPGIVRELSILRTLGISRRQCFVAVVVEAATVSCAGALTGYTVGYPIVIWLTGFLLKTAAEIYHLDLSALDPSAVVVQGVAVVAGMTVLGSVSAAIGAREVLTLAPYRGTRREQIHNVPLSERVAFRNAAIATAVGALCILALSVFQTTVLAYASIIVMLIWAGYTAPLVLCIMTHFLALFPAVIPLRLARASLRSSGRQFILTVVAGCIAISLMTSLSIMVSSFRGTLEQWSALRLSGDLFVSSAVEGIGNEGRIALPYWRSLQAAPGIRAIIPYFETVSSIAGRDVVVGGVDVNVQCARKVYPIVAGGCDVPTPHGTSRALISESASRKLGFGVADSFELNGRRFMAAGVVQEFGTEQPLVILDQADFLARYPGHQPKSLTIDLIDSRQLEVVRSALEAVAPHELVVRDHGQLMKLVRDIFNRTFRVTDSIRWMVFIIAMLGIVSTAIQHLWERRREFKTALIMGVSRTSLATSLAVESLGCALVALILGLVAGTLIGWCLTAYVNPLVFGWSLRFSPGIGPLLEALFFVVVIAGIGFFGAYFSLQIIAQRVRMADE